MGVIMVGLPFIVRNVLGFRAQYYGAAESALAIATIVGSITAGLLAEKWKIHRLAFLLTAMGAFLIPAGFAFLCPIPPIYRYLITIVSFCGMQIAISIFSIFAVSLIQQRTPNHLIGKVMAYTSTVTLCVQPVGQIVYGFWFDSFKNMISLCLLPTGVMVGVVGLASLGFLRRWKKKHDFEIHCFFIDN